MKNSNLKELMIFSKTLKVLYVEDNEEARTQALKMLGNFFVDITTSFDGKDGLSKFNQGKFDLIISDINMPNMNGLEMLEEIRKVDQEVSCIILSAHNDSEHFSQSIKIGVDGYLLKPIDLKQYLSLLTKTIDKIKNRYENLLYKKQLENINSELEEKVECRTKELEEKLFIDDLTGIASRHAFLHELSLCLDKDIPTIFLLNIDSLGAYNELYGIETGNGILIEFSKFLQKYADDNNYSLYRISGDEFVLYERVQFIDLSRNEKTLDEIFPLIADTSFYIKSIDDYIKISVTIGISFSPDNPLGKADMAMKAAKTSAKRFSTYTRKIDNRKDLEKTLYWKKEIELALIEDRVVPFFQPIVNRDSKIIKYEALMRIRQIDDKDGEKIVSPFHFLPISMKTKQYNDLSFDLIKKALDLMGDRDVSLSININLSDIHNSKLMSMLKKKIIEFTKANKGTDNHIILEILEDDSISDYQSLSKQLSEFKELGAKIAIDDFGSGYSNFMHIIGISPHYLKIDATLIKDIDTNEKSYVIVKAVIGFAKSLGIKTIAEFVSKKEIFDIVHKLGVDEFQGYYFSEPLDIKSIE